MQSIKIQSLLKLTASLLLAFLASQILVSKITYKESPVLRPSFQQSVHNLPTKILYQVKRIASLPSRLLTRRQNPPPWIEPVIKPTIVAYKPPIYYPPTSTPKPTRSPKPTDPPLPTATPIPQPPDSPITRYPDAPSPTPRSPNTPIPRISPISPTPTPQSPQLPSSPKSSLLSLINQERQKNGISSINSNTALNNAAQAHADDMVQNNYFSHTGRDGSSPADRAVRAGYGSRWTGENIAGGTRSPSQVFSMWMGSTGHRQNILNPAWKSAGIGLASNRWVLLLGAK